MVMAENREYIFQPEKAWQCRVYEMTTMYRGRFPERYEFAIPIGLIDAGDLDLLNIPRDGKFIRARSKRRVEVGVWDTWNDKPGHEGHYESLAKQLDIMRARNLTNDHVFVGRTCIVSTTLLDYSNVLRDDDPWRAYERHHCLVLNKVQIIL
jgi:hypothetical protein